MKAWKKEFYMKEISILQNGLKDFCKINRYGLPNCEWTKKYTRWKSKEVAQQLRIPHDLSEALSLIPITRMAGKNHL